MHVKRREMTRLETVTFSSLDTYSSILNRFELNVKVPGFYHNPEINKVISWWSLEFKNSPQIKDLVSET